MTDSNPVVHRVPIVISESGIALVTLFNKPHDNLDDMWALEWISEEVHTHYKRSAAQMIGALGDRWTPAFLMALRDQITATLAEHDAKYGTAFAARAPAP
jgi:hypothetical protein